MNLQGTQLRTNGYSLVEVLISMTLGLILLSGALQIFVRASVTHAEMAARQRMLEGARLAISFLGDELMIAGYLGCFGALGDRQINNNLDAAPASFQPWFGLQGWESTGTAFKDAIPSATTLSLVGTTSSEWNTSEQGHVLPRFGALPNSDILRTWSVEGAASTVVGVDHSPSSIRLINALDISRNDFVLVSDCASADIVQACAIALQPSSAVLVMSGTCMPGNRANIRLLTHASAADPAEAMRIKSNIFYVSKRGADAKNPPALFRRSLGSDGLPEAAEELVKGVESMQLLYGVAQGNGVVGGVHAYLPADQVSDFSNVVSVRLNLLMRSVDYAQTDPSQKYEFNGVVYSATGKVGLSEDRRLRHGFVATYYLRNHGLGL